MNRYAWLFLLAGWLLNVSALGAAGTEKVKTRDVAGSVLEKGVRGYLAYVDRDGSVSHTCKTCLCPGKGTKADYKNYSWVHNDPHAFGPVVLAFAQAYRLGIKEVEPLPAGAGGTTPNKSPALLGKGGWSS